MKTKQHMGRAATIVAMQNVTEILLGEDLAAYHAPSECGELSRKKEALRWRAAMRAGKSASGLSRTQFRQALQSIPDRHMNRLIGILYSRHSPFQNRG